MAIFSNVSAINRLSKRLQLQSTPTEPNPFALIQTIQPVTDLDSLLRSVKIASASALDLSAAAGTLVPAFTVPAGKRWYWIGYVTSATVANSSVQMNDGTTGFILNTLTTSNAYRILEQKIPLEETWIIGRLTTGNGGDSSETMQILYEEEDAFRA